MAGFFPTAGTDAANTQNAARPVSTEEGCKPLFYRANCAPEFDPIATNALISEIINAINIVKTYDCSRLDNLAQAFKYLGNLCNLPTLAELEISAVTNEDTLAGCFSDLSGRISIEDLRTVILDSMLCGLPTVTTAKETDFIAGCFDGKEGKVPFSVLRGFLSSFYTIENIFYTTPTSFSGTFSVAGKTAFGMSIGNGDNEGRTMSVGNITYGVGASGEYLVIKKGTGWYAFNNGMGRFLWTGDTIPWTKNHIGNQVMAAYNLSPF